MAFELSMFRLDGKVAVVTGSGTGLGKAMVHGMAKCGAIPVVTEVPSRLELAKGVASEIAAEGGRAIAVPLDVTDLGAIQAMVDTVVRELGRIDILVNNAGINITRWATEVSEADWDKVLDIDLKGTFFCSQAVGKHMIARGGGGKIVNIASQNGVIGYFMRAAYCSAKAGQVNLTRVLALEWAKHGINVNAVGPTFVKTPLTEQTFNNPDIAKDLIGRIPMGRIAEPEEIVGAVVFLSSPAAAMVTGHMLLVDGGWTAI